LLIIKKKKIVVVLLSINRPPVRTNDSFVRYIFTYRGKNK